MKSMNEITGNSEHTEMTVNLVRKRRDRTNSKQLEILEKKFSVEQFPNKNEQQEIAENLNQHQDASEKRWTEKRVRIWFQNRRARIARKEKRLLNGANTVSNFQPNFSQAYSTPNQIFMAPIVPTSSPYYQAPLAQIPSFTVNYPLQQLYPSSGITQVVPSVGYSPKNYASGFALRSVAPPAAEQEPSLLDRDQINTTQQASSYGLTFFSNSDRAHSHPQQKHDTDFTLPSLSTTTQGQSLLRTCSFPLFTPSHQLPIKPEITEIKSANESGINFNLS